MKAEPRDNGRPEREQRREPEPRNRRNAEPNACLSSRRGARRSGRRAAAAALAALWMIGGASCQRATSGEDASVTTLGAIEVTARLLEVPQGAIFKRDLYHYATVLEYEVIRVHRGKVDDPRILVGHYDPWRPRWEAADDRVPGIGGDLDAFRAGDVHRMALEASIDEHYMGGIVNQYFEKRTGPIHWAVWTNQVVE